ncbi:uncharacterized protein LOC136085163 [Hydra vulgaris]|uniref:Uncharacterized protein LOC136085163 n=1 Tax=Hydra vulgaris TaxID=6087 RepID=A0ABM4CL70_HYDVU
MTTSEILNFTEMLIVDNGVERFEFHEYEPVTGTNLNSPTEIRINVELTITYTLPSEAFLLLEEELVKSADGTAYANTDAVALTNNGMMHLFRQATYQLSNQDIESVYYPDTATSAVLADNSGFAARQAYIIQKPTTKGTFSFFIPLRLIFGFCDDYNKVIYGFKQTITLVRQRLSVKASPERPRYIIVAFQTSKSKDQNANASIFDHCGLKSMYIMLNQDRYPYIDYNLSFLNQQFSRAYREAAVFN